MHSRHGRARRPAAGLAHRRLPLFRTASVGAPVIAATSGVRAALVIAQLALSHVLLAGPPCLMTALAHLLHTDTGFKPDRVAAALYYLPDGTYVTRERIVGFHRAFIDRVSHLPGIAAAGLLTPPPFGMGGGQTDVVIEGRDGTIRIDGFRASPGALQPLVRRSGPDASSTTGMDATRTGRGGRRAIRATVPRTRRPP